MSQIRMTLRPDGSTQIEIEADSDDACKELEAAVRAAFDLLGCGELEGDGPAKRTAVSNGVPHKDRQGPVRGS